jgi:hypothetical protein
LKYPYPYLECDRHSGPQKSYAVCTCVATGAAPVETIDPPSEEHSGIIVCPKHADDELWKMEDWCVICAGCAEKNGLTTVGNVSNHPLTPTQVFGSQNLHEGIEAVIYLQSMVGVVETEDSADKIWCSFDKFQMELTLKVYYSLKMSSKIDTGSVN